MGGVGVDFAFTELFGTGLGSSKLATKVFSIGTLADSAGGTFKAVLFEVTRGAACLDAIGTVGAGEEGAEVNAVGECEDDDGGNAKPGKSLSWPTCPKEAVELEADMVGDDGFD